MRARTLGRAGPAVSEIGFGAWGIGGWSAGQLSYGPTDDAVSLRALEAALDAGIAFFDTSCLYGLGHSERLIGKLASRNRERMVIATKAGWASYDGGPDFSAAGIVASTEGSLGRLGIERIDLMQLHGPSLDQLRADPGIIAALERLRQDGKIATWGISLKSPDDAAAAICEFRAPVVQVNFNMMDLRFLDDGGAAAADAAGTGVILRTPLCFGFLSGTLAEGATFPAHDHRHRWPAEQVRRWVAGGQRLQELCAQAGQTPTQAALRFCLSFPWASTVIPGILTEAEAVENAAAAALGPLPAAVLETVLEASRGMDFVARA